MCAAACASRGRPRHRRYCCFGRPPATDMALARHGAMSPQLAARRAAALAVPPTRRPAELGKRVLVAWRAPHPRMLAHAPRVVALGDSSCASFAQHGSTALISASNHGHEGCVRLLLESEAIEVNATDVSLERARSPAMGPLPTFHVVISFVSSLLSSERRKLSSAWRGIPRSPRDRQASPRTRRRSDAANQSEARNQARLGQQDGPRQRKEAEKVGGRGPAERA